MRIPEKIQNLAVRDRQILFEFYGLFSNRQWFDKVELLLTHPTHMKRTLEVSCNYNPLLEMKDILTFTQTHNLAVDIVDLSHK
jgi:hypothetical protein